MNENITENTDRFYKKELPEFLLNEKESNEKSCSKKEEPEVDCEAYFDFVTKKNAKIIPEPKRMEFCPELILVNEAKRKGLNFTVGKEYPVIERKNAFHKNCSFYDFLTIDDKGQSIWVDEKYFIPGKVGLMHEKDLGGFTPEKTLNDSCKDYLQESVPDISLVSKAKSVDWGTPSATSCTITIGGDDIAEDGRPNVIDIRKMAKEKNIWSWSEKDAPKNNINEVYDTLKTLSGIKSAEQIKSEEKDQEERSKVRKKFYHEGLVKDDGNPLMKNATKCAAAIDKVFGNKKVVDPDEIILVIQKYVPHLRVTWYKDYLEVNGAKTKISYQKVQEAYSSVKELSSVKTAQRTVAKLVSVQLKKVF